jgi:hypothetical protein
LAFISKIKNNDKERKTRKGEMRLMLTYEPHHLIFKPEFEDLNEYQLAIKTILLRIINTVLKLENNKNDFQSEEHHPQTSKPKHSV